ncbi:MAG: PHP domain-containing protein [Candidatus Cryptobacteroides sp.]
MMKRTVISAVALAVAGTLCAQVPEFVKCDRYYDNNQRIEFQLPDIEGFVTLTSDLHIHTVFSDGAVWPATRVEEAWMDGLDVIAITDHIEYRPYKNYLNGDLNESYRIAAAAAGRNGVLVIQGAEITRSKPFGHMNALFIEDACKLEVENELDALDAALAQGAVIQWNHPGWPDDLCTMYPLHEKLIAEGKIHLVEVHNYDECYPISYDWIGKYGIGAAANSDVHEPIRVLSENSHKRPVTLIFAKEKSLESVKEALLERRTLAFFDDELAGDENLLRSFVGACLEMKSADGTVTITNRSEIPFKVSASPESEVLDLPAFSTIRMNTSLLTVHNCHCGSTTPLTLKAD